MRSIPEIRGARRHAEDIIEKCGLEDLAQGLVHRYARRRRKIQAAYLGGTHRDSQRAVPMPIPAKLATDSGDVGHPPERSDAGLL
jgi:hypothetical protein